MRTRTSASFVFTSLPDHFCRSLTEHLLFAVWQEISTAVGAVISTWWEQPEPIREALQAFRRELFKPLARRLSLKYEDDDDVDTVELRTLAYTALANSGDAETLAEYRKRFEAFVESGDEAGIPNDLKTSIYSASVRHGGEKEYEKVLAVYRQPPTPAHKDSAIAGLCASRNPSLTERTLKMIMTDEVRSQVRFGSLGIPATLGFSPFRLLEISCPRMLTLPHIDGLLGHASIRGQPRSKHRYEAQGVAVVAGELCHAREALLARVSLESAHPQAFSSSTLSDCKS